MANLQETEGPQEPGDAGVPAVKLRRVLSTPLLVLYGLGVTIGAGIYVLIGAAAGRAGIYAPSAFVLAAIAMVFSACSFAELAGRYPVSAGEAAYVRNGLKSPTLGLVVGLMVVLSALVSSAAITIGGVGYIQALVDLPESVLIVIVLVFLGGAAAWGILESVGFAAIFTIVEIVGLVVVIGAGLYTQPDILSRLPEIVPSPSDGTALSAVAMTGLLAFFAFIGFEDLVNLAEEARSPARSMPWAIFLTLAIATAIYVLVVFVAVTSVPPSELAKSGAPLSLVYERITGLSPVLITLIAIVATLNGVIVQIVMASRVLYGLGVQKALPSFFSKVNKRTRTPLLATASVVALALMLALFFPLELLAEITSSVVLSVFALVNLALWQLKRRGSPTPAGVFVAASWIPPTGFVICVAFLLSGLLMR